MEHDDRRGAPTAQLPAIAIDHGDLVEVAAPRGTRLLGTVVGVLLFATGLSLLVLAPGAVSGDPLLRVGFGGVLAVAGLLTLLARGRRLAFDREGATLYQAPLPPRTLTWGQVGLIGVERRSRRSPVGGVPRRPSGGTDAPTANVPVDTQLAPRHDEVFVELRLISNGDEGDLALDLGAASVADGQALLTSLHQRGWIPRNVRISVDGSR